LLGRYCGDRREGCIVAGGVTELEIAGIAVFFGQLSIERQRKQLKYVYMEVCA
jgi:hypothetical protein